MACSFETLVFTDLTTCYHNLNTIITVCCCYNHVGARETLKCVLMCDRGLQYDRLSVMSMALLVRLSIKKKKKKMLHGEWVRCQDPTEQWPIQKNIKNII